MKTLFLLMAEFDGQSQVPLTAVSEKYFGLADAKAKRAASLQKLPVPVYRGPTQKSPWLISLTDLAEFIDKQRATARENWEKMKAS